MVDGTERPALNSNGKPIHWSEEGVRNFWRWFGDSKVVDAQGRPLVVYHSSLEDLDRFRKAGKFMGHTGTSGISVTDSTEMASRYLDRYVSFRYDGKPFEKNILPLYVKADNPLYRQEPFPDGFAAWRPASGWLRFAGCPYGARRIDSRRLHQSRGAGQAQYGEERHPWPGDRCF